MSSINQQSDDYLFQLSILEYIHPSIIFCVLHKHSQALTTHSAIPDSHLFMATSSYWNQSTTPDNDPEGHDSVFVYVK